MQPIQQPADVQFSQNGIKLKISFRQNFAAEWNGRYAKAQTAFSMECLKLIDKYTPFDSGTLIKSAMLASHPKDGLLTWATPYARRLYYHPEYNFQKKKPLAGAHWGERMLADNLQHLRKFAADALKG